MTRRKSTRRPRTSDLNAVDHWYLVVVPELRLRAQQIDSILTLGASTLKIADLVSWWIEQHRDLSLAIAGDANADIGEKYRRLLDEREDKMLALLDRADAMRGRREGERCQ